MHYMCICIIRAHVMCESVRACVCVSECVCMCVYIQVHVVVPVELARCVRFVRTEIEDVICM